MLVTCLLLSQAVAGRIIYVDDDANGLKNGTSWANAYNFLQDALADANSSNDANEIWVAAGTYKPDQGGGQIPGDRGAAFHLINGVGLYGGFPSGSESNWDDRDPNKYETILSGDLAGDDIDVNDPCDLQTEPTRAENSYHIIVAGIDTNENAVIDGFSITCGNTEGFGGGMFNDHGNPMVKGCTFSGNSARFGGGMCNDHGNPMVKGCTFSGNSAEFGGGMYNYYGSPTTVTNCTFNRNSAIWWGGAISTGYDCNSILEDCTFTENTARYYGGGMSNFSNRASLRNCVFEFNSGRYGCAVTNWESGDMILVNCVFTRNHLGVGGGIKNHGKALLINCTFDHNKGAYYGGGIHNEGDAYVNLINCKFYSNSVCSGSTNLGGGICNNGVAELTNCIFSGNTVGTYQNVSEYGGGVANLWGRRISLTNCVFINNSATRDGGGLDNDYTSEAILTNCIFWGNTSTRGQQIDAYGSTISIDYCNIQGGQDGTFISDSVVWPTSLHWGVGNVEEEPLLTPDGHLRHGQSHIKARTADSVPNGEMTR